MKKYEVTFIKVPTVIGPKQGPPCMIKQIYVTNSNSNELLIVPEHGYTILAVTEIRNKPIILK